MGRTLALAGVVLATALPLAAHDPEGTLDPVAWLAGCWQRAEGNRVTEEQWMRPLGGTMVGMSRTVDDGRTVAFEQLRIEARDGTLVYVALPSGQRETPFSMTGFGPGWVEFANRSHDFPQVVRYRLRSDGSLLAQIEGPGGSGARVVDFPFDRVQCP